MTDFITKDSGVRAAYESGMVRDTQEGKARFDLMVADDVPYEEQFLTRIAQLMTRGMEKYGERNWEVANSDKELKRFRGSALRHMMQWFCGELDEDHASAAVFNLLAAEMTAFKMRREAELETDEILDDPATMAAIREAEWQEGEDNFVTVHYVPTDFGDPHPTARVSENYTGTEPLAQVAREAAELLGHKNPELYGLKLGPDRDEEFLDDWAALRDVVRPGAALYLGVR